MNDFLYTNSQEEIENALEPLKNLQILYIQSALSRFSPIYKDDKITHALTRIPLTSEECLSNLTSLELASGCIDSMEPISWLSSKLDSLSLRDNWICSMSPLRKAYLPCMRELNIAHNIIGSTSGMERMEAKEFKSVKLSAGLYIAGFKQFPKWQVIPKDSRWTSSEDWPALKLEDDPKNSVNVELYNQICEKVKRSEKTYSSKRITRDD